MSNKKVLIVGGTGYLGQHLLQGHAEISGRPYDLAFTYHSSPPPRVLLDAISGSLAFPVDLKSGSGFEAISKTFGQPDVVVNCAAISVPRACEIDADAARAINVPSSLVKWLQSFIEKSTFLIHLSTDQVYEGEKSFYKEDDIAFPVNVYGKTKVEAEKFISEQCSNFAILRSSIIYGPQTISPVPKSLPIQWMDGVLAKGEKVNFFHDEFRSPIYVKDLMTIVLALTSQWISEGKQMQLVLNAGGPDRVSRVQMAEAVAQFRGYDTSLIQPVSASSVFISRRRPLPWAFENLLVRHEFSSLFRFSFQGQKVDRGVRSPADISMDITRLVQILKIHPTSFKEGVRLTLTAEAK